MNEMLGAVLLMFAMGSMLENQSKAMDNNNVAREGQVQAEQAGFLDPEKIGLEDESIEEAVSNFFKQLNENLFDKNCTEEEAIAFIKKAQQEQPELFEKYRLKSGTWTDIVDHQIKAIKALTLLITLAEIIPDDKKTEEQQQFIKETKTVKDRVEVVLSLFKKAGCKPIQEQSEN